MRIAVFVLAGWVLVSVARAAPFGAAAPAPIAIYPDIVADGGGFHVAGVFVPFNGSASVRSNTMVPLPRGPRPSRDDREPCRFAGSFTLKNAGTAPVGATGFDVYTWLEQPQGPQAGEISNTGYFVANMQPGAVYTQTFGFDVKPGTYILWMSIDPRHKLKQANPHIRRAYRAQLYVSCGLSGIMRAPAPAIRP